ncbi:GNAT family N-acetyltransferase [soil metagenome]
MDNGNKTALTQCRFLNEDCFEMLYNAFIEAFSDYVIPFALTETQFRNHIILTAVDLNRTIGCLDGERLVGFSLNGFGDWHGKKTVYDAGTGVVPDHRRRGVSEAMFHMMLPLFREKGIEQCLLEVITTNTGAISLYKKLDFYPVRELALLQCDGKLSVSSVPPAGVEIREIFQPDWVVFTTFWDGEPSWQNSVAAVERSNKMKRIMGAFIDGKCVGYIVFSSKFGRVAQFAVDKLHRNRGIGTELIKALQRGTADGFSFQIINIDKSIESAMTFLTNRGFYERLSQHEMIKAM